MKAPPFADSLRFRSMTFFLDVYYNVEIGYPAAETEEIEYCLSFRHLLKGFLRAIDHQHQNKLSTVLNLASRYVVARQASYSLRFLN